MDRVVISFSPTSYLRDHILLERVVVPATTLLLEVGQHLTKFLLCKRVGLTDAFFLEPLVVSFANEKAETQCALMIDARARTVRLVGPDETSSVIFVAKYFIPTTSYDNAMLHPQQRLATSILSLNHNEFYEKFVSFGYGHKGAFRTVESVTFRETESIVEVNARSNMIDAAVDGVLQAFILKKLLATSKDENELSVPFALKEVVLTPDAHVHEKAVGSFNDTDFWLFSTSTEPLIHGKGLVFKKIHRPMPDYVSKLPSPVFVRATACRLPGGVRSLADLANLIMATRTTDTKIPAQRFPERNSHVSSTTSKPLEGGNFLSDDIAAFDAAFFGISALEAKAMDPQHRLLLEVTYECFQHAGTTNFSDCGFFVGQMGSEYSELPTIEPINALGLIGGSNSVLAGRLNFFFDSQGPSEAIDTACSSSLVALKNAVDAIRLGRCERAIVAGTSLMLSSAGLTARNTGNLLSVDGACRTFDVNADGYGRADGIVAILIDGKQNNGPYLARIDSIEVNHGGRAAALTVPNSIAQSRLITKTIRSSGHRKIDYWECHGTGTGLGDPIEISALQKALGRLNTNKTVFIGSVKANIGHCEGASGLVGLLKAIIVANECYTSALPRFTLLNKNISIDDNVLGLSIIGEDIFPDNNEIIVGVSSFGVSGTNAAVVAGIPLSEGRNKPKFALATHLSQLGIEVLPFSANSQKSLESLAAAFEVLVTSTTPNDFRLYAAAAALTRPTFNFRSVFIKTAIGDIAQVSMAQAQEFAFCVDFTQPVSWKLYYRNPGLKEFFLQKINMMTDNGQCLTEDVIKIADVRAKWQWLHAIGVKCTQIAVSTEEEANVAADLASAFVFAKVVDVHNLPPGCLAVNSKAYPLVEPWHLNRVLACVYLSSTDIDWSFIYEIPNKLRNYLPTWVLPTYCFDRKRHWNKVSTISFDNALIGNVVSSVEGKSWQLENLILKRRLLNIFNHLDCDDLNKAIAIEIIAAIGLLIGNGGSFKLAEVFFNQLPQIYLFEDNVWLKTTVKFADNTINVNVVITDSRRSKEIPFSACTATLIEKQERVWESADLFQEFCTDVNFVLTAMPHTMFTQKFQLEYAENELNIVMPVTTITTIFEAPVLRGGTIKVQFNNVSQKEDIINITPTADVVKLYTRQAIKDILKGTILEAVGNDITLTNDDFETRGFMDLGMDSLSLMGFLGELNQRHFPLAELTTTDLFTYTNIRSLTDVIMERLEKDQPTQTSNIFPPVLSPISPFSPSNSNVWDIISQTPQAPSVNDISLRYDENTNYANVHCSKFSFDVGPGDSFDVLTNKISKLMLTEIHLVFLFNAPRDVELFDEADYDGTIQFLLSMATVVGKLRSKLWLTVIENENPVSGFFAGFWKSYAIEKQNQCQFEIVERIRPTKKDVMTNFAEPCGTWVITGGTTGIGLVMARHLANFSTITKVYVISRRGVIDSIQKESSKIVAIATNVSVYEELITSLKLISENIDGVIHSAGTVADSIVERQNIESFKKVIAPKVIGMYNILKALREIGQQPRFIILNSSVSSVFGNFGQTNYSAANAAAESLLEQYRDQTGVGSIIHWGNWNDVGMASDPQLKQLLHSFGFVGLNTTEGLAGLDFVFGAQINRVVIAKLDRSKIIKARPDLSNAIILTESNINVNVQTTVTRRATIVTPISNKEPNSAQNQGETTPSDVIAEVVYSEMEKITKQSSSMPVLPEAGFMESGFDSITMYTFAQNLTQSFSTKYPSIGQVSIINLFEHANPRKLINYLKSKLPQQESLRLPKTSRSYEIVPSKYHQIKNIIPITTTFLDELVIHAHIIQNKVVVPGAFEIDLMLRSGKCLSLQNVEFYKPISATDLINYSLLIDDINFKIKDKQNNVVTRAHVNNNVSKKMVPPNLPILNGSTISINPIVFYKSLELRGVMYGKEIALLSNIEIDDNCVYTRMQFCHKKFNLPPWVLIESGMQALIAAAERKNNNNSVLLPARIQSIDFSENYLTLKDVDEKFCRNIEICGIVTANNERFVEGNVWICVGKTVIVALNGITAVKQKAKNFEAPITSSQKILHRDFYELRSNVSKDSMNFPNDTLVMKTEIQKKNPIILGYACQLPGPAENVSSFWEYLINKKETFTAPYLLSIDPAYFDPSTFGITPKEAAFIDPQHRLLMKCTLEALQNAGIVLQSVPKSTGIFIGCSSSDYANLCATEIQTISSKMKGFLGSGTNSSCAAGRLAHWLKTSGPAITVDTGCSSFAVALSLAADAIWRGDIKFAIVGSANIILSDDTTDVLNAAKMLSPNGRCATFSADADGYARSEGIVVTLLGSNCSSTSTDKLSLSGWAVNHNGGGAALTVPNSEAQIDVMKKAILKANISSSEIDFVECHGSGTSLGDPIEVDSVLKVFQNTESQIVLTATKAHIGHAEAAATGIAFVAVCEMLKHGFLPPQPNISCINNNIKSLPHFEKVVIPHLGTKKQMQAALVNSFGFSGTNCSFVINRKEIANKKLIPNKLFLIEGTLPENLNMSELALAPTASISKLRGCSSKKIRTTMTFNLSEHQSPTIVTQKLSSQKLNVYGVFIGIFSYPSMFLAELIHGNLEIGEIITQLKKECTILGITSGNVLLNAALIVYFKKINFQIEYIFIPNEFDMKNCQQLQQLVAFAGITNVTYSQTSTTENMQIVDFGLLFEDPTTGQIFRPSAALIDFVAQTWQEGAKLKVPQKMLSFVTNSGKNFNEKRYWCLTHLSRPAYWYKTSLLRRGVFQAFEKPLIIKNEVEFALNNISLIAVNDSSVKFAMKIGEILSLRVVMTPTPKTVPIFALEDKIDSPKKAFSLCKLLTTTPTKCVVVSSKLDYGLTALLKSINAEKTADNTVSHVITIEERKTEIAIATVLANPGFYKFYNGEMISLELNPVQIPQFVAPLLFQKVLITGGTGGIALSIIPVLPAKEIIIVSRSATCSTLQLPKNVSLMTLDVSVARNVRHFFAIHRNIDCIIHCAGIVDNGVSTQLTLDQFEKVAAAKILGTQNLLKYCDSASLQKFIAMSSVAAEYGSFGQANYAWANGAMETILNETEFPKKVKKLVIAWGPWNDVGMLAGVGKQRIRSQIEASGWKFMSPKDAVDVFLHLLSQSGKFVVYEKDHLPKINNSLKCSTPAVRKSIANCVPTISTVSELISHVSGIQKVDPEIGLMALGLDSLMIEDFRSHAETAFNVQLKLPDIYSNPSVKALVQLLSKITSPSLATPAYQTKEMQQNTPLDDFAIIAYDGTTSGCETVADYWKAIFSETDLSTPTGFHLLKSACNFDHKMFRMSPQLAMELDIQTKLALKHAHACLTNAGYYNASKPNVRVACFGCAEPVVSKNTISNSKTNDLMTSMYAKNVHSFLPAWISHLLDLRGPCATIYSACSSTLTAIQVGIQCLKNNDADVCLIIAASVPSIVASFSETSGIAVASGNCCRPFDKTADGLVPGAAVGAILLKRLSLAVKDGDNVHAVIKGVQISNDGFAKANFMAPGTEGQIDAMKIAQQYGLVDYVECHATGTAVGDRMEITAMNMAYKQQDEKIIIGSVKANIGHCFAAAGMTSIFKVLGIFKHAEIPRQLHLNKVVDELDESTKFVVAKERQKLKNSSVKRAVVHAFGIGGTNGCLVIESFANEKILKNNLNADGSIAFFFAPQGVQYANMLTANDFTAVPTAKSIYDHLISTASIACSRNFKDIMKSQHLIEQPEYAQVALFVVHWTIVQVLKENGINAAVVLGHSLGEYAALCYSGAISPDDAIFLLATRSKLMASTVPAKMISYKTTKKVVFPTNVEVSAYLSSNVQVAVGPPEDMDKFAEYLTAQRIDFRWLRTSRGFHSSMMNSIVSEFQNEVEKFLHCFVPTQTPVISNRNGKIFDIETCSMPLYLSKHLRDPVRIDKSLDTLLTEFPQVKTIVEIGPPGMLTNLLLQRGRKDIRVVRTLPTKGESEKMQSRAPVFSKFINDLTEIDPSNKKNVLQNISLSINKEKPKRTNLKLKIATFWSDALGTIEPECISSSMDFFALGGNSLSAVQLCWRIEEELKLSVPVSHVFDNPTFDTFCSAIAGLTSSNESMQNFFPSFHENTHYPLCPAQEQMFILHHLEKNTKYNIVFSIRIKPLNGFEFSLEAAEKTINTMLQRQTCLRTIFYQNKNGEAYQKVLPMNSTQRLIFSIVNLDEFEKAIDAEKTREFDLSKQAFSIKGFELSNNTYALIASQHHIVTDGWSMTVFAKEFSEIYSALVSGKRTLPRPMPLQYCQLSEKLNELSCNINIHKFAEKLSKFEASELPSSFNPDKKGFCTITRIVDMKPLIDISVSHSTTVSMATLTAFCRTLALWTDCYSTQSLLFGIASSGRIIPETRDLIGYFLNNLVFALNEKEKLFSDSLVDTISYVKTVLIESQAYEAIPYHRIVAEVRRHINQPIKNLFKLYYNYRHSLDFPKVQIHGVTSLVVQETNNRVFDLSITMDEIGDNKLQITADFEIGIYTESVIQGFLTDFVNQINNLSGKSEKVCSASSFLTLDKCKLIQKSSDVTLATVIQNIAHMYPDRVALVKFDGTVVTYSSLINTARRRALGIQDVFLQKVKRKLTANDVIPLIMDFNSHPEWFLAVIFAGGVYAPIEASYPEPYICSLIEKVKAIFCIIEESLTIFKLNSTTFVTKASELDAIKVKNETSLRTSANANSLLYVLFTSGSTGMPKGVKVTHHNVLTFLNAATKELFISPVSIIGHSVNTVFDVSVFNIFAAWTNGATLQQFSSIRKAAVDTTQNCTHLFLPSAVFNALGESSITNLACQKSLEYLIIGGETPITTSLAILLKARKAKLPFVVQIYGPTEATVWVTMNFVTETDGSIIGNSMKTCALHLAVLNYTMFLPKNSAAVGEICISGDQLANGYIDDNCDGFKTVTINGENVSVFATGDFGQWLPNGKLKFLGRKKNSFIKRNGIRIDLKMIEDSIQRKCAGITETSVLMVDKKLIGFVANPTATNLSSWKKIPLLHLPSEFVPDIILELSELPITTAGKRDNNQLLKIAKQWMDKGKTNYINKIDECLVERSKKLALIWTNILKNTLRPQDVKMESDFFALGGASIDLFQLKQAINDAFDENIDIDKLFKMSKFENQLQLLTMENSFKTIPSAAHIVEIRRAANPVASVYCLHAIGGTVYPFYTLDTVILDDFNIYGVPYDLNYPARDLFELAEYYLKSIISHSSKLPIAFAGHSLGGALAHLIVHILFEQNKINNSHETINVIMFDSWCLGTEDLNLTLVKDYLETQFKHLNDSEKYVAQSMRLAGFLQKHQFNFDSRISVCLFKASILTASPLRKAIMPTLTPAIARSFVDNGWTQFSASVTTILTPGDHDSLLKAENLASVRHSLQLALRKATFILS